MASYQPNSAARAARALAPIATLVQVGVTLLGALSMYRNALRFLFAGEGDVPPLSYEILRRAVPDPAKRPVVHVGG